MLREIKMDGKLIGHHDTERGMLGHVEWYYLDKDDKRQFGGGDHTVAGARKSAKRRYLKERGEWAPPRRERTVRQDRWLKPSC